jgi:redox-sensitive bicupin YhaK (pirin superfamily)
MPLVAYPGRPMQLNELPIWRALPARGRRLIGPWCFLDRYGPLSFTDEKPMDVAPHPHIGIQTVSWLLEGEILHRDSLGFEAPLRAGGVNVMTSGRGIAHSEETPRRNGGGLNGVQLWVAMPDADRNGEPGLEHVDEVPVVEHRGGLVRIFTPERRFSPMIGADVEVHPHETLVLPLDTAFEHGLYLLDGDAVIEQQPLTVNTLYDLGAGRAELAIATRDGARLLLIGGEPFPERVLMWWNFVARTPEEIAAARTAWQTGGFGPVRGYDGPPIPAPPLAKFAPANPAS